MLAELDVLNLIGGRAKLPPKVEEKLNMWRGVYYRMSLHIDGICPAFKSLRYNERLMTYVLGKKTFPNNWSIEYQELFDIYYFSTHPKEPEITRQWRYSQYKPFTQAPFIEAIDIITGAIFQDSGYVVKVDDKEDSEYINGNNFHGKTLVEYLASNFASVCSDPNGYFVFIPTKPRNEFAEGEKITVEICYIFTKQIRYISRDEIIFEHDGYIWNVNKVGYFRYEKGEDGKTWYNVDGENDGYYAHMLEELPIIIGGGKWNAQGFYDSWLMGARPHADEFISGKSAEQMVNKEASYPSIIESEVQCPQCHGAMNVEVACGCDSGCDVCGNTRVILERCDKCDGKGYMSRNPGDRMIVPYEKMNKSLIEIVNPDISINQFHAANNKELYRVILESLHLYKVDQAQSGEAKKMDMQGRYQFLNSICKDWFYRIIDRAIWITLSLRGVISVSETELAPNINPEYTIIAPNDYQIKSGYDLGEEYKMAVESKAPEYVREGMNQAFVDKQFGGDELMKRKANYIQVLDPVNVSTVEEVQAWALLGAISQQQVQMHVLLPNILNNIIREMGADEFMQASFEAIQGKVMSMLPPPPLSIRPTEVVDRINI
jgi:hypothetical protein